MHVRPTQITWIVHQIPHLQNVGFSLQSAALITGAYGPWGGKTRS